MTNGNSEIIVSGCLRNKTLLSTKDMPADGIKWSDLSATQKVLLFNFNTDADKEHISLNEMKKAISHYQKYDTQNDDDDNNRNVGTLVKPDGVLNDSELAAATGIWGLYISYGTIEPKGLKEFYVRALDLTLTSNSDIVQDKQGFYYMFDESKGEFVKRPDIKSVDDYGYYVTHKRNIKAQTIKSTYTQDNKLEYIEACNYKGLKYKNVDYVAQICGLKKELRTTSYCGIPGLFLKDKVQEPTGKYYNPSNKMFYVWSDKTHGFYLTDGFVEYDAIDDPKINDGKMYTTAVERYKSYCVSEERRY